MMNGLKQKRKEKELSMRQLGKIFDVSLNTINNYETGKREPDFAMLKKMAEYFNCKIDDLM